MIKFRCSSCDTKIGVPLTYSGKLVKCPQCTGRTRVPDVAPVSTSEIRVIPKPVAATGSEDAWNDQQHADMNHQGDQQYANDFPQATNSDNCPHCGNMIDPNANYCFACRGPLKGGPSLSASDTATIDKSGVSSSIRLVIAVVAGCAVALLGAAAWAGIACAVDREFGLVAWILGALIGLVVMVAAGQKNAMTGGIAVLMALLCIVAGKLFIAKWYLMPGLEKMLQSDESKQVLRDELKKLEANATGDPQAAQPLSKEEIQMMIDDPEVLFAAVSQRYRRSEKWDQKFTDQLIAFHSGDFTPTDKQIMRFENARKQVLDYIADSTEEELRIAVLYFHAELTGYTKQLYEEMTTYIDNVAKNMKSKISMTDAFKEVFSLLDILWIVLAIGSAYKLAGPGKRVLQSD